MVPFDMISVEIEPVYRDYAGWERPIDHAKNRIELPQQARRFITQLEQHLDVPITMISVGPERDELLVE